MRPEHETITLPAAASPPAKPGFPYIAALAPVAVAVVMWAVTSSPFALLCALLAPVLAIAGVIDARRTARRRRAEDRADVLRRLEEVARRVEERAARWRAAAGRRASQLGTGVPGDGAPSSARLLGTGDIPSALELVGDAGAGPDEGGDPVIGEAVAEVRRQAASIPDAPIIVEAAEVHADGSRPLVRAFARSLLVQAAASHGPAEHQLVVPEGEEWARGMPHRVIFDDEGRWEVRRDETVVFRVGGAGGTASQASAAVTFPADGRPARVLAPQDVADFRPHLLSAAEAVTRAREILEGARRSGWQDASLIPDDVDLADIVHAEPPGRAARDHLAVPVGVAAHGPAFVDLVADGPHALVAGTTGSGKSELLVSWVLALARRIPPDRVSFLLVDFKGGSAFAPLAQLPHVVGVVSDLDPASARRAVESLRAELRRREHILAEHGARDIAGLAPGALARLVVVVDEFAALMALDDGLASVFADLAARGRSLGIHLILCTQRPAGIVRDGVLANITLRVCLRVLDAADSNAVVGSRAAADLPASVRGRAVIAPGDGTLLVQVARASGELAEETAERWRGHPTASGKPWLEPPPALIPWQTLGARDDADRLAIGIVDRPEEQRQHLLELDPWSDGAVLVMGAAAAGRTTALATLARAAASSEVRWVPDDPAELWQALDTPAGARRALVLADDLDRTLGLLDPETRADLVDLIRRTARDGRRTRVALAASTRSVGSALHGIHTSFEQRLLLRMPSREEHVMAGGDLADHRQERRPGSVIWNRSEAQLALSDAAPAPWRAQLPTADLRSGAWAIAAFPAPQVLEALRASGIDATGLDGGGRVVVGDPDSWLADYGALARVRRDGRLLLVGCTPADQRTLTRSRAPLPPLSGEGDAWLTEAGATRRVELLH